MLMLAVVIAIILDSLKLACCNNFNPPLCTAPLFTPNFTGLRLGLPPNATNFVSGFLPVNNFSLWYCNVHNGYGNSDVFKNAHGLWVSYKSHGGPIEFTVFPSGIKQNMDQWAMYVYQKNNDINTGRAMRIKVCKWHGLYTPVYEPNKPVSQTCLINKQFNFIFRTGVGETIGITWSSNYVTLYGRDDFYQFYLEHDWDNVQVRCSRKESCFYYVAREQLTYNVTTGSHGQIISYNLCSQCNGFPAHVFSVQEGGYIPADFDFTNWFVLTNTSTVLSGRLVATQPMKLLCLWPVPVLNTVASRIYFNTSGANCNGYASVGEADALRFSLNFTSNQVFNGINHITVSTVEGELEFSCSNATEPVLFSIPFGHIDAVHYCFVRIVSGNRTENRFVGILPPVVKEIVISRWGSFYVNGVQLFESPEVESVIFNVTSKVGSDFWTIAYAQSVDVLLEVNSTSITNILYCDSPTNLIKCQQLSFRLDDGFYAASSVAAREIQRTYVALPYHATHMFVNFTMWRGSTDNDSYLHINGGIEPFCVNTTQFTTTFEQLNKTFTSVEAKLVNGDCPFTLSSLNNYLSFESICFSVQPVGASCTISIHIGWMTYFIPWRDIYVTYKHGSAITGVTKASTGIFDPSFLVLDECTDYSVYGISGRGVIRHVNTSYISGLYYTSIAGQIIGFKNATTGDVYSITPCDLTMQAAVIDDKIVGVVSSVDNITIPFSNVSTTDMFYYHSNGNETCADPIITYGSYGICKDGTLVKVDPKPATSTPVSPISTANITVPVNFTVSIQVEFVQMYNKPVSVDCAVYVCSGNPKCLRLLTQYASACRTIEDALQLSARLESVELLNLLTVSDDAVRLANISYFDNYNVSALLPRASGRGSFIEDLLFDKVVTSGLGTVDQDYKACAGDGVKAHLADTFCAQYYNGIMVLPGVVDATKMGLYTTSLLGGMVLGGLTSAAAIPFSVAVQSRLNYVALQTDVLQRNQQQLATAFNNALGNITLAFSEVKDAIQQTSDAINTVAQAMGKIQTVVNEQGHALSQLTRQLASNFQAISSSIQDIYNRLEGLEADAQVDRLITGRLAALNAFVTQTLTKYTEVRASRQLAQEKVNECVKSQSVRFGFCGNGTHLFSLANAAPQGIMFFHTVLVPTQYIDVQAWAGVCVDNTYGLILRNIKTTLFKRDDKYYVTTRDMYEPRVPVASDFVRIANCSVTYVNITQDTLGDIIPEYVDVNKTLDDLLNNLPNYTVPDLNLDKFNQTYLNLSGEIDILNNKAASLENKTLVLQQLIENLNKTYVDLEWLNRVENYVKWPWYVWLAIFLVVALFSFLMLYCCIATGCCGCCSCLASSLCDCTGKRLQRYEVEKIHVQ
uniref:Spike protein n=1 Tax=Cardioderma bat coronavirus/Kenya/KY43/2006 TaxID=983922 RepID=F1DAX6_9ALPC|nr:spike protein [Cardioderma bat coronavirus/Kenya/KY43/2006]